MTAHVVAVDLGGTDTKIARALPGGAVEQVERLATPVGLGQDGLVDWLSALITARTTATAAGFGVVVPGVIDAEPGVVRTATNLGWRDLPLLERLSAAVPRPGVVGHDVRAAGLAEWRLGSGGRASTMVFLPLGTGIAAAYVVDGRLVQGTGSTGEVGHLRVPAGADRPCVCGSTGCLETVASAAAVVRSYRRAGAGSGPLPTSARDVAERARAGDLAARAAFALVAEGLAEALAVLVAVLGPESVVVGGGLAAAADLYLPEVIDVVRGSLGIHAMPDVRTAALGGDAGVVGAGLLAWERLGR